MWWAVSQSKRSNHWIIGLGLKATILLGSTKGTNLRAMIELGGGLTLDTTAFNG